MLLVIVTIHKTMEDGEIHSLWVAKLEGGLTNIHIGGVHCEVSNSSEVEV
jgi:hypothetical protein